MIRTTKLKGDELRERLTKLSQPLKESVSMVEPSKYHNRISPSARMLQTFNNQNDNQIEDTDEESFDMDEFISELEDEMMLDEILAEMGYYEDDEELEELKVDYSSKGYKEARKLVSKLRSKLFRELNDDDLETFVNTLADAFGMVRR